MTPIPWFTCNLLPISAKNLKFVLIDPSSVISSIKQIRSKVPKKDQSIPLVANMSLDYLKKTQVFLTFSKNRLSRELPLCTGHYNQFFTPFFTELYNAERLVLQTVYVLNKEIQLGLKSAVYNQ
jgi:hypothetical protein